MRLRIDRARPRHPTLNSIAEQLGGSIYSALATRIAGLRGEVYPLHIGDTWVRVCLTCSPPDVVERGIERLARRLGR